MNLPRTWKIILFLVGIVIGILLMLAGIFKIDDVAQIRLEGSELWLACIGIGWSHGSQKNKPKSLAKIITNRRRVDFNEQLCPGYCNQNALWWTAKRNVRAVSQLPRLSVCDFQLSDRHVAAFCRHPSVSIFSAGIFYYHRIGGRARCLRLALPVRTDSGLDV